MEIKFRRLMFANEKKAIGAAEAMKSMVDVHKIFYFGSKANNGTDASLAKQSGIDSTDAKRPFRKRLSD